MDSTASSGKSRPSQTRFVFTQGGEPDLTQGGSERDREHVEDDLIANLQSLAGGSTRERVERCSESGRQAVPLWLRRLQSLVFVLICLQLGLMLVVLPWEPVWNTNVFLLKFPTVHAVLQHLFIRGLVTGLGVVDLWIGISEAVHYREGKKSRVKSPPQ